VEFWLSCGYNINVLLLRFFCHCQVVRFFKLLLLPPLNDAFVHHKTVRLDIYYCTIYFGYVTLVIYIVLLYRCLFILFCPFIVENNLSVLTVFMFYVSLYNTKRANKYSC